MVALLLAGSATLLYSCADSDGGDTTASDETLMTEFSENLSIVMSRNGQRSYYFTTPLVEGYSLAREPYREFRKGVKIITYKDDSLTTVDAVLTANYAIYYEKRELWEAKGNVVAEKSDGKTLYTQQLFWNQRTKKIYSNVDSKIVQSGGRDVFIGEGFESDEEFKDWRFRRMKGRMEVDVTPTEQADSTATAGGASSEAASAEKPAAEKPAVAPKRDQPASTRVPAPRQSAPASSARPENSALNPERGLRPSMDAAPVQMSAEKAQPMEAAAVTTPASAEKQNARK